MAKSQAQAIDNLVGIFQDDLQRIVADARNEVISTLGSRLSVVDGLVAHTKTNQRILQSVDDIFQRQMDRAGYPALVKEYVTSFNGQFAYFQDTLDTLGEEIGRDLTVTFGKRDTNAFLQQQVSTTRLLDSIVDVAAANAERQAMMAVGGVKLKDLIGGIASKLDETVGRATTLADTSLSMFYRTIQDRGYKQVERGMPDSITMRFRYGGPNDRLTRPFCERMLEQTRARPLTRDEIDDLDNGQLDNVFLTCGGFNCRHQWILMLRRRGADES